MTDVQVRAAVKAQKAADKMNKLTYRGVAYLKQPKVVWFPERVSAA